MPACPLVNAYPNPARAGMRRQQAGPRSRANGGGRTVGETDARLAIRSIVGVCKSLTRSIGRPRFPIIGIDQKDVGLGRPQKYGQAKEAETKTTGAGVMGAG